MLCTNEGGEWRRALRKAGTGLRRVPGLLTHHVDLGTLVKVAVTQVSVPVTGARHGQGGSTRWVPQSQGRTMGQADRSAGAELLFPRGWLLKEAITPLLALHLWPSPSQTRWLPPGLHSVSVAGWRGAWRGTGLFPSHLWLPSPVRGKPFP